MVRFLIFGGIVLAAAALILFFSILISAGLAGMLIALAVAAAIGGAWSYMDERRMERQYKEDTKCS